MEALNKAAAQRLIELHGHIAKSRSHAWVGADIHTLAETLANARFFLTAPYAKSLTHDLHQGVLVRIRAMVSNRPPRFTVEPAISRVGLVAPRHAQCEFHGPGRGCLERFATPLLKVILPVTVYEVMLCRKVGVSKTKRLDQRGL